MCQAPGTWKLLVRQPGGSLNPASPSTVFMEASLHWPGGFGHKLLVTDSTSSPSSPSGNWGQG